MSLVDSLIRRMRDRGLTLSRLQAVHPAIDKTVRTARRLAYTRRFFRAGPRKRGAPGGKTFVVFNHCYDLDIDALCAAESPHTIWVLDAFELFTDVFHFFDADQRELTYSYADMGAAVARYKAAYITRLARQLRDETGLDVFLTPTDTLYYLRPLIEELRALGVPTVVQCKEGTIAPSPMMTEHARDLAERYPPFADRFLLWNATHRDYWHQVGYPLERMRVCGQPRSDFFAHAERWPSKTALGLREGAPLVVAFTFDSDAYVRVTVPDPDRPWLPLRDHLHQALRELARARPDVDIVVKAHPQQAVLAEIEAEFAAEPLPNLHVVTGAKSASHLMVRADVILGFQTTALIEAMLTRAPVIYVGWGPKHDARSDTLVPIHKTNGVIIPHSRAELEAMLRAALAGQLAPSPAVMTARRAFTDRYFADADGNAARRVLDGAAAVTTS